MMILIHAVAIIRAFNSFVSKLPLFAPPLDRKGHNPLILSKVKPIYTEKHPPTHFEHEDGRSM
jgi:hypothetical protein